MTTIAIDSTHIASDTLSVRGSYIESLDTGKIIKHGDHYFHKEEHFSMKIKNKVYKVLFIFLNLVNIIVNII